MSDDPQGPDDDSAIPPPVFPPPLGREKPVRPAGWQPSETSTPPSEPSAPLPESQREPTAAFTPRPQDEPPRVADNGPDIAPSSESLPPRPVSALPPAPPPPVRERYPMRYDVIYPAKLSRWKTFFRIILIIPAWIFSTILTYALYGLMVVGWTAVFWRKKYPSWAFQGLAGAFAFTARLTAYGLLQTDRYPSFDKEQSLVTLEFDEPPSGHLSRWRVFWWKLFLLIPHLVVLGVLRLALAVVTILSWFAIVATGNYPRGMFAFTNGVVRWHFRVAAYFASFNDRFPPYALSEESGPAGNTAVRLSAIGGWAAAIGVVGLFTIAAILSPGAHNETINYAQLQKGIGSNVVAFNNSSGDTEVLLRLARAYDPGDDLVKLFVPPPGSRVVVFEWEIANLSGVGQHVPSSPATLSAASGGKNHDYDPVIFMLDSHAAPYNVPGRSTVRARAVFVLPAAATPVELSFDGAFSRPRGVNYKFVP